MVDNEPNELLRLIAATIIQKLVTDDFPLDLLWPMGAETDQLSSVAKSNLATPLWMESLVEYMNDKDAQRLDVR
jgi:hypothetical protein